MGHPLRLLDPLGIYHVVSRGNNGGAIVRDALDRRGFRARLDLVAQRYAWNVFAWCLMTTHYHLVLRAPAGAISRGMQVLNTRHARAVNWRHGRSGHLFQNRFFSVEVASDAHFVASVAYVNRNPVSAFLVEEAADWRDSGYRSTMGLAPVPEWLLVEDVLGVFGGSPELARAELAERVSSGRVPVSDTLELVRRYEARGIVPEPVTSG